MTSNTIRVLLIDDDRNYFTLTSRMLARTQQDFEVEWVDSYDAALQKLRDGQHQVYLIDYHLGERSGLDLLRAAVLEGITAPMIVMTGQGEHDVDMQAIKAGAADYVDKTELKPALLQRAIRYALERNRFIKAVYEGEERYRNLLEEASDGIIITDSGGNLILVNARAREMLGYSVLASKERQNGTLTVGAHMRDLIHASDIGGMLDSGLTSDHVILAERTLRRADGSSLEVEVSGRITGDDRRQFIIRDVSQRRQMAAEREKYIQQLTVLRQVDDELSQMLNVEYVLS
ncbi:MAG: response regulator, partial [Armatimonadetes bacterium]|nr:response regulator [Anaerolineae bacterium]